MPKLIITQIAPGQESIVDSKTAKIARTVFTAALFSAAHLANKGFFADSYVALQLVATFVIGLAAGALKENKPGLCGAIGLHAANNILAITPMLLSC